MPVKQVGELTRLLVAVVHALQHYVLESELFIWLERLFKFRASGEQFLDRPFPVDRHQLVTQLVRRRRERDGQVWPIRYLREVTNAWDYTGSRDRDPVRHNM